MASGRPADTRGVPLPNGQPGPAPTSPDIDPLLRHAVGVGASDLHLKVPSPPVMRLHGRLEAVAGHPPLTPAHTMAYAAQLTAAQPARRAELESDGETDLAYGLTGCGRFRVNVFRQRGALSIALRAVPTEVKTLQDLGLPQAVGALAREQRGIVLATGTTGSGKSTTLAAMIDQMNRTERRHIVTIEDPIEYLHQDRGSIINQREVGTDTGSFAAALRRVLRQDPDVIMIGEIRDLATMETALSAAETGHLVLSTMHTLDATETVNRAIGFFPLHQQGPVRAMLAGTLKGIVSQRLVPTADGEGRAAACEVMVVTGRARDMITNPDETGRLHEVIKEGDFYGMQTFDQSLFAHVTAGRVSLEEALAAASSPHDFRLMLDAGAPRREAAQYV